VLTLLIATNAAIERSAPRLAVLTQAPLLSQLSASALARIDYATTIERHRPGETILAEGAPPGDAYIIWRDSVKICEATDLAALPVLAL
jgi:hypothetical protein